jgi:biotin carboxyl carrier protein
MTEKKTGKLPVELSELKELNIQGTSYYTKYTRKYETRKKWTKSDEKKLISFIPGTIKEIFVKEGDYIKTSEKLIVMEAMKMMNTLYSPIDGKIKSILINIGDRIPKGKVIIEFE